MGNIWARHTLPHHTGERLFARTHSIKTSNRERYIKAMNSQEGFMQITFHYGNGQSESFNVLLHEDSSLTPQELQQRVIKHLEKPWCILHLPEQTVCVKTDNLLKVEIKPVMREFHGEGVFSEVQRITALSRSTIQR